MNLFKKYDEDIIAYDTAELREKSIAFLLREAKIARSNTDGYWQRMANYYGGAHDTAKQTGDFLAETELPWKPATVPDAYLHVESQIEAKMPDFEFSARSGDEAEMAKARESVVRYICDRNELEIKNSVNERRLGIMGSAVWKLALTTGENGTDEIAIENPSPEDIYPDPNSTSVDGCEYIGYTYKLSRLAAQRIFADDLAIMETSIDRILSERDAELGIETDIYSSDAAPLIDVTEWWFRQPYDGSCSCETVDAAGNITEVTYDYRAGDIALCILLCGREVRYIPKFWNKTSCTHYPFVIYSRIMSDNSIWGRSEIEAVLPLIDAADRQLAFAQLNTAFFANDILLYEENAFAPDSYPQNHPGAVWKLRPGMIDKVSRLGGLAGDSTVHYEIADKYRALMKEALGNYDFMQGDSTTQVTTATGLALLSDFAGKRVAAKQVCKKAGFSRLYRLLDYFALEVYSHERLAAIGTGCEGAFERCDHCMALLGYIPTVDVKINTGDGLENSRSFTISAISELMKTEITEENYPIVRAYIESLGIPYGAEICEKLDERFAKAGEEKEA